MGRPKKQTTEENKATMERAERIFTTPNTTDMTVSDIPLASVKSFDNARTTTTDIASLMASISANGLLQPIMVSPHGKGKYRLIAGNRRFEACSKLGWTTIPAVVREFEDESAEVTAHLIENVQRKEINIIEMGRALKDLSNTMTLPELVARTGLSKHKITTAINCFNRLPKEYHKDLSVNLRGRRSPMEGKKNYGISPAVVSQVENITKLYKGASKYRKRLYQAAKAAEISSNDVRQVGRLLERGITVPKAIEMVEKTVQIPFYLTIKKTELEKLTSGSKTEFRHRVLMALKKDKDLAKALV